LKKPRVVSTGLAVFRVEWNGEFEVSLSSSIVPPVPLLLDGQRDVCFNVSRVERESFCCCLSCPRSRYLGIDIPIILVDVVVRELAIGPSVVRVESKNSVQAVDTLITGEKRF
jgi:hypothetical protein